MGNSSELNSSLSLNFDIVDLKKRAREREASLLATSDGLEFEKSQRNIPVGRNSKRLLSPTKTSSSKKLALKNSPVQQRELIAISQHLKDKQLEEKIQKRLELTKL